MNLNAVLPLRKPGRSQGFLAGGTCHVVSGGRRFVLSVGDANAHVCRPIEPPNLHAKLCMLTTNSDGILRIRGTLL